MHEISTAYKTKKMKNKVFLAFKTIEAGAVYILLKHKTLMSRINLYFVELSMKKFYNLVADRPL